MPKSKSCKNNTRLTPRPPNIRNEHPHLPGCQREAAGHRKGLTRAGMRIPLSMTSPQPYTGEPGERTGHPFCRACAGRHSTYRGVTLRGGMEARESTGESAIAGSLTRRQIHFPECSSPAEPGTFNPEALIRIQAGSIPAFGTTHFLQNGHTLTLYGRSGGAHAATPC